VREALQQKVELQAKITNLKNKLDDLNNRLPDLENELAAPGCEIESLSDRHAEICGQIFSINNLILGMEKQLPRCDELIRK
jgi:hypothetical protein